MREIKKKISIIAVAVLFVTVSIIPAVMADATPEKEETIPIDVTTIQENGLLQTETFQVTNIEYQNLLGKLTMLINLINMVRGEEELSGVLLDFINGNNNPILGRIIGSLLTSRIDFNRQLVMSAGWGINLNPFKTMKTDFIRPITFWRYADQSNEMALPSMTASLDFNPFLVKTVFGSQLGIMLRFRGVYVHMPEMYPAQSFTFFMGTARQVFTFELPSLQAPVL